MDDIVTVRRDRSRADGDASQRRQYRHRGDVMLVGASCLGSHQLCRAALEQDLVCRGFLVARDEVAAVMETARHVIVEQRVLKRRHVFISRPATPASFRPACRSATVSTEPRDRASAAATWSDRYRASCPGAGDAPVRRRGIEKRLHPLLGTEARCRRKISAAGRIDSGRTWS